MLILHIAWYTFLRSIRDTKGMINMLLLPILLVLILGTALSSAFQVDTIGRTRVAFINEDRGELSDHFEDFLAMEEIQNLLLIEVVDNHEMGMALLENGSVRSVIYIDESYSQNYLNKGHAQIDVVGDSRDAFRTSIVRSIVESFIGGANTVYARASISGTIEAFNRIDVLEQVPLSAHGNIPRAMDYYAVTMLVLFMMYGALYALHGIGEDYLENMRNRLLSTPLGLAGHLTGKVLGTVILIFLQALVLAGFTRFAYGANWGSSIFEILFLIFTLSVFATVAGTMCVMVVRDRKLANGLLSVIISVMTFIAGGYARIISDSPVYNGIKMVLPSSLAHTAFFNSIYGDFAGQTISSAGMLWLLIGMMSVVATIAGRRRFN